MQLVHTCDIDCVQTTRQLRYVKGCAHVAVICIWPE
jgi:hypothetical protein